MEIPSTPMSEASTKFDIDATQSSLKSSIHGQPERKKSTSSTRDILIFLVAFRILNALSIRTFFQPDEYFQSLEPAWQIAYGNEAGAWITWVSPIPVGKRKVLIIYRNGSTICVLQFIPIFSRRDIGLQDTLPTFYN
jgi:hypothetical protein